MRIIDLETWPRRKHFAFYQALTSPHINICAPVDITQFYTAVKARGLQFTIATLYIFTRVANEIPEFRYRIRGSQVVEHDQVHPSNTVLMEDDIFSFCPIRYIPDWDTFAPEAVRRIEYVKSHLMLENVPGEDDLIFLTSIPWVAFTSIMHAMYLNPADSIPRIAWGKHELHGDTRTMPLAVQAHHALMDGLHIGRYFQRVQYLLDHPDELFGAGTDC